VARILVVDDDASVRELMAAVLQSIGHAVDVAANGPEALAFLERTTYDLIVCDLRMPVLDGAGLYARIRDRWPALLSRLIFVSGNTAMPEIADFLRSTQPYILPKPFAIADLEEAVQRMLAVHSGVEA